MYEVVHVPGLVKYHYPVSKDLKVVTRNVEAMIPIFNRLFPDEPIALACRGSSGLMIATVLALHLEHAEVVYIRKDNENAHTTRKVINTSALNDSKLLVVDDFAATGATVETIVDELEKDAGKPLHFAALCVTHGWDDIEEKVLAKFDYIICI